MKRPVTSPSKQISPSPAQRPTPPVSAPEDLPITVADQRELLYQGRIPPIVTVPLRVFLGITFAYAGVQKLTDPGFFRPHAVTYIGTQIAGFAHYSPIGGFLTAVALPHAVFFGALIAWGEVAIGLGTLIGLLFRPAATFGAMLSAILWLSATWQVKPYFYGADIFALFGWITLVLAGTGGALALDPWLGAWVAPRLEAWVGTTRARHVLVTLGLTSPLPPPTSTTIAATPVKQRPRSASSRASAKPTRRDFVGGLATGVIAMLTGLGLWNLFHATSDVTTSALPGSGAGNATAGAGATAATSGSGSVLATLNNVPTNSAVQFTIPSNQDPGVLVRLSSGSVVAFDATCTHAGCTVQYDSGSQTLICPCHGATFDPAHNAAVLGGPAPQPLAPVAITVDQQTGAITLA